MGTMFERAAAFLSIILATTLLSTTLLGISFDPTILRTIRTIRYSVLIFGPSSRSLPRPLSLTAVPTVSPGRCPPFNYGLILLYGHKFSSFYSQCQKNENSKSNYDTPPSPFLHAEFRCQPLGYHSQNSYSYSSILHTLQFHRH
ncbi:hypothetical protein BDN70DRAFT_49014 [Pholiota conissans]|uniref:Uncharacterized protein n=1 Tax=Pholiota conissans TaxID=109636 RepID=A0A9P6D050_9AGAR|nr:hypothetical protein BDN70DRAFT_49014 [Pholiota conissans]